jgi:hypothetical protein
MSEDWFVDGDQGELRLVRRDGRWYVKSTDISGNTVCLFDSENISMEGDEQTVSVHVENFRRGTGDSTNYLMVTKTEDKLSSSANNGNEKRPDEVTHSGGEIEGNDSSGKSNSSVKNLTELRGSGEYVTIEVEIRGIEYVEKNKLNMPDMKGVLTEEGSTKRVPFIVQEGVTHPYFEEGKRFRLQGVKDHRYEKKNEVQVLIGTNTEFTEL